MSTTFRRLTTDDLSAADAVRLGRQVASTDSLTAGEVTVPVSDRARRILVELLAELAAGRSVDIVPVADVLTTSEAADLLGVSRPTLVKMLNDGLIAYERPGVHRRVSRAALDAYIASRPGRRAAALEELADTFAPDIADDYITTR